MVNIQEMPKKIHQSIPHGKKTYFTIEVNGFHRCVFAYSHLCDEMSGWSLVQH